jgi:hypothetical protein
MFSVASDTSSDARKRNVNGKLALLRPLVSQVLSVRKQQLQTITALAQRLVENELNLGRSLPKEMVWGDSLHRRNQSG